MPKKEFRLPVRTIAIGLTMALLLAACGGEGETDGGTDARSEGRLPPEEQVIDIGYSEDSYRTLGELTDFGKWPLYTRVTDTLVNMNDSLQVEPMLAERWEQLPDTNTFRFYLREGVQFHDGSEMTAEDVKYTMDRIIEEGPRNYQKLGPESVQVVEPHTIDITPTEVNNRLVLQLVHPQFGINKAGSDFLKPVGTGPFRFAEYVPDSRFVVERFDDYWDDARIPEAQRITFRFLPDLQTRLLGLRSGELDLIGDIIPDAVDEIESSGDAEIVRSGPGGAAPRIDFNIDGEAPYDLGRDPQIREAVALAIDLETLIETVEQGNADPAPLPRELFGDAADFVEGVPYDPEQATKILRDLGWKPGTDGVLVREGRRLSLSYLVGSAGLDPAAKVTGEVLQSQLRDVGIEITIDPAGDAASSQARRSAGEFDLLHQGGSQNEASPCFVYDLLYYSPERGGTEGNRFHAPGGAVDTAIEGCRTAVTLEEVQMNAAEAARLLVEVEHIRIPLGSRLRIWGVKKVVKDFVAHPALGRGNWEDLYLVEG